MKTINEFQKMKEEKNKISLITCYDYWSARIIDESYIDAVLVGDSAAMVMHGFESTVYAEVEMMCYHIAAVKRGLKNKFLIGDLPFLSNRKDHNYLMDTADRFMKSGSQAVKLEGADGNLEMIEHLVKSGVPVMGHLGLMPQSVNKIGGYKIQGNEEGSSKIIFEDAVRLQQAGCFAVVLEMVPSVLAEKITSELKIPTIGIGAGPDTDGQVLVLQDLLGLNRDFNPKFVRKYINGYEEILGALNGYCSDVRRKDFPNGKESN